MPETGTFDAFLLKDDTFVAKFWLQSVGSTRIVNGNVGGTDAHEDHEDASEPSDLRQHSVTGTIRTWARLAAGAASCALLVTGCASTPTESTPWAELYGADIAQDIKNAEEDAPVSEAQIAELLDGTVTEAEISAAFERYRSCLRAEGYELVDIHRDGPFIGFGIPDAAV